MTNLFIWILSIVVVLVFVGMIYALILSRRQRLTSGEDTTSNQTATPRVRSRAWYWVSGVLGALLITAGTFWYFDINPLAWGISYQVMGVAGLMLVGIILAYWFFFRTILGKALTMYIVSGIVWYGIIHPVFYLTFPSWCSQTWSNAAGTVILLEVVLFLLYTGYFIYRTWWSKQPFTKTKKHLGFQLGMAVSATVLIICTGMLVWDTFRGNDNQVVRELAAGNLPNAALAVAPPEEAYPAPLGMWYPVGTFEPASEAHPDQINVHGGDSLYFTKHIMWTVRGKLNQWRSLPRFKVLYADSVLKMAGKQDSAAMLFRHAEFVAVRSGTMPAKR